MADVITSDYRLAVEAGLRTFVATALEKVGVPAEDAAIVADVLVAADLRGVESHGVARLASYYVNRIRAGALDPTAELKTMRETPTSILTDACNGLGHPAAKRTMDRVIAKAAESGAAFGATRGSNHFGIAGYYAMMALDHDMIGIASTNSVRFAAPTFGRDVLLGTNPLAFAIPAKNEPAFVLDFATTTVTKGKLEVYNRKGKQLNPGWAADASGNETLDPQAALTGALLPLGGYGVDNGGHKGYGLGLLVDILCGVLSGGAFGDDLPAPTDGPLPGKISHFFAAFKIDGFRDPEEFKADMDTELRAFKDSAKAPGHDRIYVAGEIEHENTVFNRAHGVPVHVNVWDGLQKLAAELDIPFDLEKRVS
jgi:LDH2 family malate/lactate/ureidoglycolate dehydrogenase